MEPQLLAKSGLTENQARAYLSLLDTGGCTAKALADKTNETRTNAYALAEKLVSLGLAQRNTGSVITYSPLSPTVLKQLILQKQQELRTSANELQGVMPELLTKFRLVSDQPGVLLLEGRSGIKTLYNDIIATGQPISIIASTEDKNDPDIEKVIDKQIQKQKAAGITVRAIYSDSDVLPPETIQELLKDGVETHVALSNELPAQIIIYGNNVAISTFGAGMITALITHPAIAATMQALFNALWRTYSNPKTI